MPRWTYALGALVSAVALAACDTVTPDPADASPASVVIKVKKDNAYEPATTAKLGYAHPLELVAVAEDDSGLKAVQVTFLGRTSDSCTVGSSVYGGSFAVTLPKDIDQQLKGNAQGEYLTTLPVFTMVSEKVTCTVSGQQGRPIGHTFTVRATATNWGAGTAPAVANLTVTIQ